MPLRQFRRSRTLARASARPIAPARKTAIVVFAIVAAGHLAVTFFGGVLTAPDTRTYNTWADALIAGGFWPSSYAAAHDIGMQFSYAGFVTLAAALKLVFQQDWINALVALNIAASAATATMVTDLVFAATFSRLGRLTALVFYVASFDIANWVRFGLKESTFLFLSFAVVYLALRPAVGGGVRRPWLWRTGALAALVLALGWRQSAPTLLVVPAALAAAPWLTGPGWLPRRRRRLFAAAIVLLAAGAIAGEAAVLNDPAAWPSALPGGDYVAWLAERYHIGLIIEIRKSIPKFEPGTDAYIGLTLRKLGAFFAFTAPSFSAVHDAAGAIYYVPLYGLAAIGLWGLPRSRLQDTQGAALVAWTAAAYVAAVALFHAMTLLDFDWRYRLPIVPPLIVLASFGVVTRQETMRAETSSAPASRKGAPGMWSRR